MGIYNRDNINYGGLLGNAMAQRANIIQRDYENYMRQPEAWSNAVNQSGQVVSDALMSMAKYKYDENQKALDRQQQLNVLNQQQEFNKAENALNRENMYKISELSRKTALEQQAAEKRAQAIMNYDVYKGALDSVVDEIMHTDDPEKLRTLYKQRDEMVARMNYYAKDVPPEFTKRPPIPYVAQKPAEVAQTSETVDNRPSTVKLSDFVTAGKNATKSADVKTALDNIGKLDVSKLGTAEQKQLEADVNELQAKLAKLKANEEYNAETKRLLKAAGNNAAKRDKIKAQRGVK